MKQHADILVIGGGAIGICCAHFLSAQGHSITVVERDQVCSGASYGNAGLVVPSFSIPLASPGKIAQGIKWLFNPESPFFIKPKIDPALMSWLWQYYRACRKSKMLKALTVLHDLQRSSLNLFQKLEKLPDVGFSLNQNGLMAGFITPAGLQEAIADARMLRQHGVKVQILDRSAMAEVEPGVRTNAVGGIYYPMDAHIDPAQFVRGLAAYVQSRGVTIYPETEVLQLEMQGRRVRAVRTTRGDIFPEQVVLCGGAWSPEIVKSLKLNLPIQPAKGYSVTYRRSEPCPQIPFDLGEAWVIVTPLGDTIRIAGTLELAGFDLAVNQRRLEAILRVVPRYLPDLLPERLELIEIWRGLRPCTPDGLPIIGHAPRFSNLILAAGHGMLGIAMAPITGALVADILAEEQPSIDIEPLRATRFSYLV
jgi:D-amino-acid dehydrogenase